MLVLGYRRRWTIRLKQMSTSPCSKKRFSTFKVDASSPSDGSYRMKVGEVQKHWEIEEQEVPQIEPRGRQEKEVRCQKRYAAHGFMVLILVHL